MNRRAFLATAVAAPTIAPPPLSAAAPALPDALPEADPEFIRAHTTGQPVVTRLVSVRASLIQGSSGGNPARLLAGLRLALLPLLLDELQRERDAGRPAGAVVYQPCVRGGEISVYLGALVLERVG